MKSSESITKIWEFKIVKENLITLITWLFITDNSFNLGLIDSLKVLNQKSLNTLVAYKINH